MAAMAPRTRLRLSVSGLGWSAAPGPAESAAPRWQRRSPRRRHRRAARGRVMARCPGTDMIVTAGHARVQLTAPDDYLVAAPKAGQVRLLPGWPTGQS